MVYSIIIAVYNRPDEMEELLASLAGQTDRDFEVVVVEDGSTLTSEEVCRRWAEVMPVRYFSKPNDGPGPARNYGCERAEGEVFIFLDSDCTVPPTWLAAVTEGRMRDSLQAFGGPDREHPDFSVTQKAISYAMTSLLTTGGIRGGRVRVGGAFHPRSFNMGMDREVYATTRGFSAMRFGEDIDLSIRMMKGGYRVGLIPEAWVYHKRRTDFGKFFKQVHNSGMARINLTVRHPGTLKITHFFPTAVTLYLLFAVVCAALTPFGIRYGWAALIPIAVYAVLLFAHATIAHRSLHVGVLSVAASAVQLVGYGTGFIRGMVWRVFLGKPETQAFKGTFYK